MKKVIAHVKDGEHVIASKAFQGESMGNVRAQAETWAATRYQQIKGEGRAVTSWSTRVVL